MGKIIHGNKNFGYAPINYTGNTPSFGTPVMIPGLVSVEIEVDQEDTSIYADDVVYCMMKGAKVRTATATFRNIPKEYAQFLGFKMNDSGMLTDTGVFPSHCIFFMTTEDNCETGTSIPTLHYLYNVKGSEPTQESSTDEDEVEAAEIEVEYSATDSSFVVDDDNNPVQYGYIQRTEENKTIFDAYQTSVVLPVQ